MGRRRAAALVSRAAAKALAKEDARGKPRGGASYACPSCGGRTEVVDTRRNDDGVGVRRVRQCVAQPRRRCRGQFVTDEMVTVA